MVRCIIEGSTCHAIGGTKLSLVLFFLNLRAFNDLDRRKLKPSQQVVSQNRIHLRQTVSVHQVCWNPSRLLRAQRFLDRPDVHQTAFVCQCAIDGQQSIVKRFGVCCLQVIQPASGTMSRLTKQDF